MPGVIAEEWMCSDIDDARRSVVEPSGRAFVLRPDSSQPVRVHLGARLMDGLHGHDGEGSEDRADAGDQVRHHGLMRQLQMRVLVQRCTSHTAPDR